MEYENKRLSPTYRDSELRPVGRHFSDAEMQVFDERVDRMQLTPEQKQSAKRVLRKMQGLPFAEGDDSADAAVTEALRGFAAAMRR